MSASQTVTLDAQRAFGAKVITVLCWLFVPLVAIAAATANSFVISTSPTRASTGIQRSRHLSERMCSRQGQ